MRLCSDHTSTPLKGDGSAPTPYTGTSSLAIVGESSVILMTPPFFTPIETPDEGRGGCSRMTVSPTTARVARSTS